MMYQATLLQCLGTRSFPFRVAIFPAVDPELGPFLQVSAFSVPEHQSVAVSLDLTRIVRRAHLPQLALAGAFDEVESADQLAQVPQDAVWYEPHARTQPAVATAGFPLRPPLV